MSDEQLEAYFENMTTDVDQDAYRAATYWKEHANKHAYDYTNVDFVADYEDYAAGETP